MFERFTVDMLAEAVHSQLEEGNPTPKLVYRFFRKGRRDGRKGHDPASIERLLVDAVQLAGSTLAEEWAVKCSEIDRQLAEEGALVTAFRARPASATPVQAAQVPAAATSGSSVPAGGVETADLLTRASASRRRLRGIRDAEHRAAEERARREAELGELSAAKARASEAEQAIERLKSERARLPHECGQRFESIRRTGGMLWARYCDGFAQGVTRRGSQASDIAVPGDELEFRMPSALADALRGADAERVDD